MQALSVYRAKFKPSDQLTKPYAMVAANVIAADTDREAERLFTSMKQVFLAIRRGKARQMQPPVDSLDGLAEDFELAAVEQALRFSAVGSPETVQRQLATIIKQTQADELIVSAPIFNHEARKYSLSLTAQVRIALAARESEAVLAPGV